MLKGLKEEELLFDCTPCYMAHFIFSDILNEQNTKTTTDFTKPEFVSEKIKQICDRLHQHVIQLYDNSECLEDKTYYFKLQTNVTTLYNKTFQMIYILKVAKCLATLLKHF